MILTIDVTVTGPDSVLTGSVAVDVVVPAADLREPAPQPGELANEQLQQRSLSNRWAGR
jgi:hypothetical protein